LRPRRHNQQMNICAGQLMRALSNTVMSVESHMPTHLGIWLSRTISRNTMGSVGVRTGPPIRAIVRLNSNSTTHTTAPRPMMVSVPEQGIKKGERGVAQRGSTSKIPNPPPSAKRGPTNRRRN
jgi:hypothetical protein